jgi:UDP-N-acetylmuramoyl-tripeptide--D-alanyl-D-alanine ligase
MKIKDIYELYIQNPSISTDSRKIKKGDLFWALKGEYFDGNKFVEFALNSGAKFAVSDDMLNQKSDRVILVKDSLETLQKLAQYHRKKLNIPIILITGTNGKTTTKELIASVLSRKFKVGYTQGNLNNHIGVPLTLLSFDNTTEIGVVEAGANHPGEIKVLCDIALPDFGIITNIGKAHLEGFGSYDNLIKTKAELYVAVKEGSGIIFINDDNQLLTDLAKDNLKITYGSGDHVFCKAELLSFDPFVTLKVEFEENTIIKTQLIGKYNFENILASVCIGKYFEVPETHIQSAIENYFPLNNRSQIISKGNSNIILDAYNANPSSMYIALDNFFEMQLNNKAIIIGDMYELGDFEESEHEKIIQKIIHFMEKNPSLQVFLAGDAFYKSFQKYTTKKEIHSYRTTEDLISYFKTSILDCSWVLIKGSRGMKLETVVEHLNFI